MVIAGNHSGKEAMTSHYTDPFLVYVSHTAWLNLSYSGMDLVDL